MDDKAKYRYENSLNTLHRTMGECKAGINFLKWAGGIFAIGVLSGFGFLFNLLFKMNTDLSSRIQHISSNIIPDESIIYTEEKINRGPNWANKNKVFPASNKRIPASLSKPEIINE